MLAREIAIETTEAASRDWQIDFGLVSGKKGEIKNIKINPQLPFKGEKMMATDSFQNGMGTRICSVFVGPKSQRPANAGSTPTKFFANNAFGNGFVWDLCKVGQEICIGVEFLEDCDWDATVFGKALIEDR